MGLGASPLGEDLFLLALHPERIDIEAAGVAGDGDRHVELATLEVVDVLEEESLSLLLGQAAVLQAHERMKLGVFIDRLFDAEELAGCFELVQILADVSVIGHDVRLPSAFGWRSSECRIPSG